MQRILQISSVHHSQDTRILHKISKSLKKNGYEVDLLIQHNSDDNIEGINIISLPIAQKKIDRVTKIIPKIFNNVLDYKKNTILHFHDPELIPVCLLFKLLGYKVIYDVHEDVPKSILSKEWLPNTIKKPLSILITLIEKFAAKRFDAIITVVPTITDRFRPQNKTTVEVRNYPIIEDQVVEATQVSETYKNYVTYIGALTAARGIPQIVDAMEYVNSDVQLWVGGNFGDSKLQIELSKKKGWEKTNYLGFLNKSRKKNVLSSAIAGLVVLNDTPSYRDALPVKLYEYMLAGLPVIATNIPLWKEIIDKEKCGLVVPFDSPKQIADAIQWIYQHPEEARIMGENGRRAVKEKYNWEKEEKKLLELYESITSE